MEGTITISKDEPTDLSRYKDQNISVKQLALTGAGKLDACMITFYKNGDSLSAQKDLLFLKPLHARNEVLVPHIKDFKVSGYDFCSIQVFTGNVLKSDKVELSFIEA
jgi:hypothetical protein